MKGYWRDVMIIIEVCFYPNSLYILAQCNAVHCCNFKKSKGFFNRHYSLLSFGRLQLYHSEALLTNSITLQLVFLCFVKVRLSHRSHAGTECGLGALQHSLWPDVCSNRLVIWTKGKAIWVLCESMNFHPDYQLFQDAGAGVWTTEPWITRAELNPYTTGNS